MSDKQTNLHPKNDKGINLKPNIITENIPDKAVTFEKLSDDVQNTINTHSIQIEKLNASFITLTNLFNKSEVVDGYYVTGTQGSVAVKKTNARFSYFKFPVEKGKSYVVTSNDFAIVLVNADDVILGLLGKKQEDQLNFTFTLSPKSAAVHAYVSFVPSKHPSDTYMIMEGKTLPTEYYPYGNTYAFNGNTPYLTKDEIDGEIYEVGSDSQFTSFTACLKALQGNSNKKKIKIYGGVYDVFSEIGGAEYCATISSSSNWRDVNTIVPPNTEIVGIGDVVLNFLPTDSEIGNGRTLLSPLNIDNNCVVRNIEIHANNCRYCIHDETSELEINKNTSRLYENVRCYKGNGSGYAQAYGGGCSEGNSYEFIDCYFETNKWGEAWSMHNRNAYTYKGNDIRLDHCVFNAKYSTSTRSIRFGNMNPTAEINNVVLSGCYLNLPVWINSESGQKPNSYNVTMVGCSDVEIKTADLSENNRTLQKFNI